ncbi:MAG: energy-coupling factor transporter ATPase [Anaerolineae bacterium]
MEPIIVIQDLHFAYHSQSEQPIHALKGIDLEVYPGEYLVIIGHNGSGKSTLAKHLNALLRPTQGSVWVKGLNTRVLTNTLAIRQTVGMVFQVPDNQLVATIVEEDVAFGPENLGMPEEELRRQVEWALGVVDMWEHRHRQPHRLSAGQKQRVAIAGVIAMKPDILVLDEATSMLDPEGRREILATVRRLNDEGVTVIAITHFMEEAIEGDRVLVMEAGKIVLEGSPRQLFGHIEELHRLQLDVPQVTELAYRVSQRDAQFRSDLLSVQEVVDAIHQRVGQIAGHGQGAHPVLGNDQQVLISSSIEACEQRETSPQLKPLVQVNDLHHTYLRGTPLEVTALRGVDLEVYRGEAVGIIGRTGSGKSTLVQHLNGLLRPREPGKVWIDGQDLADPKTDVRSVRQKVGLVFQYPEQQLFERLVGDDIAFGLRKLGLPSEERRERVRWAMEMVGLDFELFKDRFTFSLSGGEMRKVALAGVLALQPEVLILDECISGLDPRSRKDLLGRLGIWHRDHGLTLILVSSNMEDVAELVSRVYVLNAGRVVMSGPVRQVFAQPDRLRAYGMNVPPVTEMAHELKARGMVVQQVPLTVAEGVETVWRILNS